MQPTEPSPLATVDGLIPFARPVVFITPEPPAPPQPAILLHDISRKAAWMDLLAFFVFWFGCEAITAVVISLVLPADKALSKATERDWLIPGLILRVVVCLAAIALILRARGQGGDAIGLKRRGLGWDLLLGLPTLAVAACTVFAVMIVIVILFPEAQKQAMENARLLTELIPRMPVVAYFALMGTVGFYEEVVFRGFLMPRLRRGLGSWIAAVLVSSVVFTLPHAFNQTWLALIPIAILGITFSIVTVMRRSIIPAVVAHALYNFGVIVYLHLIAMPGEGP